MLTFLPEISIDRIELSTPQDGGTAVRVDLTVSDKVEQGFTGEWVGTDRFLEYLQVKVSFHRNLPSFEKEALRSTRTEAQPEFEVFPLSGEFTRMKPDQYLFDSDQGREYRIPLSARFHIDEGDMFAGVVAYSELNFNALISDFPLLEQDLTSQNLESFRAAEVILLDGRVASRSYAFLLPGGSPWSGPVHTLDDGTVRTGADESPESVTLTVAPVYNYKIQDYRLYDQPQVNREFLAATSAFEVGFRRKGRVLPPSDLFSEMKLSLDSAGKVQFIAAFDLERAVEEASDNSFIFQNLRSSEIENLLEDAEISGLSLERIRVKGNNALGQFRRFRFDESEQDELVAEAFRTEYGLANVQDKGNITTLPVYDGLSDLGQVVHITGIDADIANESTGQYRYKLTVSVTDPTRTLVEELHTEITTARNFISGYINFCNDTLFYDFRQKRFTAQFFDLKSEDTLSAKVSEAISAFLRARRIMGDRRLLSPRLRAQEASRLLSLLHPRQTNRTSLENFLDVLTNLALFIEKRTGYNLSSSQYGMGGRAFGRRPIVQISKDFPEFVDVDTATNYASRVLFTAASDEDRQPGLKTIPIGDYLKRTEDETLKYFPSLDSDTSLKTDTKTYTKGDSTKGSQLGYLSTKDLSAAVGGTVQLASPGQRVYDLESSTAALDLVRGSRRVLSLVASEREVQQDAEVRFFDQTLRSDIRESQENEKSSLDEQTFFSKLEGEQTRRKPVDQALSLSSPTNLVDTKNLTENDLLGLPNHLKAAVLSFGDPTKTNIDLGAIDWKNPSSFDMFYLHYENIAQVEMFVGFGVGVGGKALLRDEKWEILSFPLLSRVPSSGYALCRLRRYENPLLDIRASSNPEIPFYDGYFLVDMTDLDQFIDKPEVPLPPPSIDLGGIQIPLPNPEDINRGYTTAEDLRGRLQRDPRDRDTSDIATGIPTFGNAANFDFEYKNSEDQTDSDLKNVITWGEIEEDSASNQLAVGAEVMKEVPTKSISTYPLLTRKKLV